MKESPLVKNSLHMNQQTIKLAAQQYVGYASGHQMAAVRSTGVRTVFGQCSDGVRTVFERCSKGVRTVF